MGDEVPKIAGLSTVVPHFHDDLIARIVPGVYLVLCSYWIVILKGGMPTRAGASFPTIITVGLFAYMVGFIIGPLSYWVFDRWCRFNPGDTAHAVNVFQQNGWEPPTREMAKGGHDHIVETSRRSAYVLWQRDPLLAIMASRWDAEAFAARQLGTATIILAAITILRLLIGKDVIYVPLLIFLVVLPGVFHLCRLQFEYSREQAILSRFDMLAPLESGSDQQAMAARG